MLSVAVVGNRASATSPYLQESKNLLQALRQDSDPFAFGYAIKRQSNLLSNIRGLLKLAVPPLPQDECEIVPDGDMDMEPVWTSFSRTTSDTVSPSVSPKTPRSCTHAHFIEDNPGRICDLYDVHMGNLGEGAYGTVSRAINKATCAVRAVKTVPKGAAAEGAKQEIAMMKLLDHPHIVKLYEWFEDDQNYYLVLELCRGGGLFEWIVQAGYFSEVQTAILMKQIARAVSYLHQSQVCHRDLKPENFLFLMPRQSTDTHALKIIDFGLARKFQDGEVMTTRVGSPRYVAPQVLQGSYGHQCDMWSVGVTMYAMLCGREPFQAESDIEVLRRVRQGAFRFPAACSRGLSEGGKELVRRLLTVDPSARCTARQLLEHKWLRQHAPDAPHDASPHALVEHLRRFAALNPFAKAARRAIARQLPESRIAGLREAFLQLDADGDGLLTVAGVAEAAASAAPTSELRGGQHILGGLGTADGEAIGYTEFLAAAINRRQHITDEACWAAFRFFDADGDGAITPGELQAALGAGQDDGAIRSLMGEVDSKGDGVVDFEEFMAMVWKSLQFQRASEVA